MRQLRQVRGATYRDSIAPWQCRKWLNANNLRAAVEAAIPAMGQDAVDGWEYATEIRRDDPLVLGMVTMLGMSENDLHQMFWQASQL